jgi:hypothetical protein
MNSASLGDEAGMRADFLSSVGSRSSESRFNGVGSELLSVRFAFVVKNG